MAKNVVKTVDLFDDALIQEIKKLDAEKNLIEEKMKAIKEKCLAKMNALNIDKAEGEVSLTAVAASTKTILDQDMLKEKHPEIYDECYCKISNVSASLRINVKNVAQEA